MNTVRTTRGSRAALGAALVAALLAGCASAPGSDPRDPWEPYNRSIHRFNDSVDDAVLKPVATAYRTVLPRPVRTGVTNFFGNLSDAWSFVNNVLQAKPEGALHSFWRVVINSTVGLAGVLDPATEMRLERRREDFGQTLGRWGVPPGPYLVLPLLGPSTLRDTAGLPVDFYGHPLGHMHDVAWRNSLAGVQVVNTRAQLLEASELIDAAALDQYTFRRDAFLQKRRNDIYDGNPPEDEERYDLEEGEESAVAAPSVDGASGAPAAVRPPSRATRRTPLRRAPVRPGAAGPAPRGAAALAPPIGPVAPVTSPQAEPAPTPAAPAPLALPPGVAASAPVLPQQR